MKLEFLALKWAMTDKFCEYLLDHKCIVFTDNNPLSLLSLAKLGALEQRPPRTTDLEILVSGTSLPQPLQQALQVSEAYSLFRPCLSICLQTLENFSELIL